jgi:hypothetical protein
MAESGEKRASKLASRVAILADEVQDSYQSVNEPGRARMIGLIQNHSYDVAISYASEDTDVADIIAARLRRDGFRCFYNPNRLHKLLGLSLPDSLQGIYGDADIVVVALVSKAYLHKPWPRKEYDAAVSRTPNRMFVVRIGGHDLPMEIASTSFTDLEKFGAEGVASQISAALEEQFHIESTFAALPGSGRKSEVSDIEALDYPDKPYRLDQVTFVDAEKANVIDVYSNEFEFDDLDHYVTLGLCDQRLGVTRSDVLESKAEVRKLIAQKESSGWRIFNGKKFGVSSIHRSRTPETEDHLLRVVLYSTDYYSSQFAKRLYRRLRARGLAASDYSQSLAGYGGIMRSFGFDIILFASQNGMPSLVLTQRSANVANAGETAGFWHVSMNEGLSLSDRYNQEFSAAATVYRGFYEELGLRRGDLSHIDLFEPLLELRNFEPGVIGAAYTTLSAEEVLRRASEAGDSLLEHASLTTIPATVEAVKEFLDSPQPRTNVLEFCLRSALDRGLFK